MGSLPGAVRSVTEWDGNRRLAHISALSNCELYLEFQGWAPPPAPAGVAVLSGDTHARANAANRGRRRLAQARTIYGPGGRPAETWQAYWFGTQLTIVAGLVATSPVPVVPHQGSVLLQV
jgi:hypothetical protein